MTRWPITTSRKEVTLSHAWLRAHVVSFCDRWQCCHRITYLSSAGCRTEITAFTDKQEQAKMDRQCGLVYLICS